MFFLLSGRFSSLSPFFFSPCRRFFHPEPSLWISFFLLPLLQFDFSNLIVACHAIFVIAVVCVVYFFLLGLFFVVGIYDLSMIRNRLFFYPPPPLLWSELPCFPVVFMCPLGRIFFFFIVVFNPPIFPFRFVFLCIVFPFRFF